MQLLKLERHLDNFFKAVKINPVLYGLERSRTYREVKNELERAFLIQTSQFLRSEVLKEIEERIPVSENTIWTEAHENQIKDIIRKHFKELRNFVSLPLLREFYLWLANRGGQSFLDKIRLQEFKKVDIIGATFDLKDTAMITELMNGVDLLIDGLDDTTEQWLVNQFIQGKMGIERVVPATVEGIKSFQYNVALQVGRYSKEGEKIIQSLKLEDLGSIDEAVERTINALPVEIRRLPEVENAIENWERTAKMIEEEMAKTVIERKSSLEIANMIREKIPETYAYRADTIVATESANIVNNMEFETAKRNEATAKRWTTAGMNVCEECMMNEEAGWIGIDARFPSGDLRPPVHPNCKCLLEYQIPPYVGRGWTGE
jgi:hypothetical protein